MTERDNDIERRTVLQIAAGAAAGLAAAPLIAAPALAALPAPKATGKPTDFDFLAGNWTIHNRQLKDGAWVEFPGASTVYRILGGVGSVEELRIPADSPRGMGLRLLDVEKKLWADYWCPAKTGVLAPEPMWGSFIDGVGTWLYEDKDDKGAFVGRGMWHEITATTCRWTFSMSRDGLNTWEDQWFMKWTRV
jgi:hypothetical protein